MHHGEGRGAVVDELADRPSLREAGAVNPNPPLELLGIDQQREREQADALAPGDLVRLGAGGGAP
jgi:hypothetical protein